MSRRAAKIDANQRAIVDALRAAGCTVQSLAAVGSGCPDLLVGVGSRNYLLEADMAVCARIRAIPDLGVRILNARDREIRRREERRG